MHSGVIVDSRPISNEVIDRHMDFLPGWDLNVFGNAYKGIKHYCPPIRNFNDYNKVLTSEWFWQKLINYDKILIFQHDSWILKGGIEDFLEWDLVGSPWKWQKEPRKGGNGGFCIRNPKKCLDLIRKKPWNISYGYEDVYFTDYLHEVGGKVAPYEVCKKWGCETIFELGTIGFHNIDKYLTPDQCKQIKNQYNDILSV